MEGVHACAGGRYYLVEVVGVAAEVPHMIVGVAELKEDILELEGQGGQVEVGVGVPSLVVPSLVVPSLVVPSLVVHTCMRAYYQVVVASFPSPSPFPSYQAEHIHGCMPSSAVDTSAVHDVVACTFVAVVVACTFVAVVVASPHPNHPFLMLPHHPLHHQRKWYVV